MKYKARVVEILLDKYILKIINDNNTNFNNKELNTCIATLRGNIKKKLGQVLVGDIVEIKNTYETWTIEKVLTRKNKLIRPPVSNIDQLILLISIDNPKPDYILLDKEIILCKLKNIVPLICVNKIDLTDNSIEQKQELKYIQEVYSKLGVKVIYTSVKDNIGIEQLKFELKSKINALSGNSGVGKSSITDLIVKDIDNTCNIEIGELTSKLKRGKHTTKGVKLYILDELYSTYLLDTPGFSSYELYDITHYDLKKYYPEFINCKCKYMDCMHVNEGIDECEVKKNVSNKLIDSGRYERYVYIYTKLKQIYDKKYK